jgi:hypothetical protein
MRSILENPKCFPTLQPAQFLPGGPDSRSGGTRYVHGTGDSLHRIVDAGVRHVARVCKADPQSGPDPSQNHIRCDQHFGARSRQGRQPSLSGPRLPAILRPAKTTRAGGAGHWFRRHHGCRTALCSLTISGRTRIGSPDNEQGGRSAASVRKFTVTSTPDDRFVICANR